MNPAEMIDSLERTGEAVAALVAGVSGAAAGWKPSSESWSLLEVICHLRDEEVEDFGTRLRLVLEDPGTDWPPIDPQGWVAQRDYAAQDPAAALAEFRARRARTLEWLRGLGGADWSQAKRHPQLDFLIQAGDLLSAWAAHDAIHLRQLAGLRVGYLEAAAAPFTIAYAT